MAEPPEAPPPRVHEAEKVRQGRIVLTTPLRRYVFFGGMVAALLLGLILAIAARVV